MTFNQNAKIINNKDAEALFDHFERKYPQFCQCLNLDEKDMGYPLSKVPLAASIILAFYGYNTIYVPAGAESAVLDNNGKKVSIDYYVTFHRSAFTVDEKWIYIRGKNGIEPYRNSKNM